MTMFTLREAAALIPGAVFQGDEAIAIERVVTDSRAVQAGDLFVAVKGDRFDAHDFLDQVAKSGAAPRSSRAMYAIPMPGRCQSSR